MASNTLTSKNLENAWKEKHVANTPNANNCSGFLYSALKEAGIIIPSGLNANNLIDYFDREPIFKSLGMGDEGYKEALKYALQNKIVIVGAKSTDLQSSYGHVALIISTGYIYGGSIGTAQSQGTKKLKDIFRKQFFPKLKYYYVI